MLAWRALRIFLDSEIRFTCWRYSIQWQQKSGRNQLPGSSISLSVLQRNIDPTSVTDLGAISFVTSQESSLGLRIAKYLSVIQCEKAFEIILADSSMKSLFWLLHIASRSACHYSSCISRLVHVISSVAYVVGQIPQVPQYGKKCR